MITRPRAFRFRQWCTHLIEHRIGHLADQPRADLDSIHLFQVALNVARAHAPRVHRQNLLVEAREPSFVLGDDLRLERPVPVTGHFDIYRPEVSLYLSPYTSRAGPTRN